MPPRQFLADSGKFAIPNARNLQETLRREGTVEATRTSHTDNLFKQCWTMQLHRGMMRSGKTVLSVTFTTCLRNSASLLFCCCRRF